MLKAVLLAKTSLRVTLTDVFPSTVSLSANKSSLLTFLLY